MAVVSVARTSQSVSRKLGGKVSISWSYKIQVDSLSDDKAVVLAALPSILSSHPDDLALVVKSQSAERTADDNLTWAGKVEFDNEPVSKQQRDREQGSATSPIEWRPNIEWSYVLFQKATNKTADTPAKLIANVNGGEFDPYTMVDVSRPVLTIKRYEARFSASLQLTYGNTINSNRFYGADPGKAKMLPMKAKLVFFGDLELWEVTYEIHFNPDGWKERILNQGFYVKEGGELVRAKDSFGVEFSDPVNLALDGSKLSEGAEIPVLDFNVYRSVNWSPLKLEV